MSFLKHHAFLTMLAATLVFGYLACDWLDWLTEVRWLKWLIVTVTMFAMAWPLEFRALRSAVRHPLAPLLAVLVNFGLVPLLAWPWTGWLGPDLGLGLAVAVAVPTTLATGPVWTRRAGGDDSIAMLVTIVTNCLCFLVTPWLVFQFTGTEVSSGLLSETVWKLLAFVVIPISLAQVLRTEMRSARWATHHKAALGRVAQTGVLMMTTLGAVQTGLKIQGGEPLSVFPLMVMVVAVVVVHTSALVVAYIVAERLGLTPEARIAVAISGSQKTMMVGLSVAISLGVSILPMVAYHALQLMIDTVAADAHRRRNADRLQGS